MAAGVGFASEAEACWPGAVPPLETKTKLINKTIRISECMDRSFKGFQFEPFMFSGRYTLRSVLANVVRVEHILVVKNDVFPFDGADMLQKTDVDIFAFWKAHFQNAGDFLGLPIDDTGQQ